MKDFSFNAANEVKKKIIKSPLNPTPVPGEAVNETRFGLTMDAPHSPTDRTICRPILHLSLVLEKECFCLCPTAPSPERAVGL